MQNSRYGIERQYAIHKELSVVPRDQWGSTWTPIPPPQRSPAQPFQPTHPTASQTLFPNLVHAQSSVAPVSTIAEPSTSTTSSNYFSLPSPTLASPPAASVNDFSNLLNFDEDVSSAPEGYKPATNEFDGNVFTKEFNDLADLPLDWYSNQ